MIAQDLLPAALKALQRLIVCARMRAYDGDASGTADMLDGIELLPEFLADDIDRSEDVAVMLLGVAQSFPECRAIAQDFEHAAAMRCGK